MNKFFLTLMLMVATASFARSQSLDSAEVVIGTTALAMPEAQPSAEEPIAEPVYWKKGGTISLSLQQVGLTNWAAGGESSFAVGTVLQAHANYEKDQVVWENKINVGYGVIRNGGEENRFEKTDDLLRVNSKYSQKFSENVLMTTTVDFRTQMDEGFKLERVKNSGERKRVFISNFMAPGYLLASVGLTYRDEKAFNTTLAPFTGRFTFVLNNLLSKAGSFGVAPGEQIRSEAGISWTGIYQKDLIKNIKLQTNFNFFSNYENFPNTVVNLGLGLNMKVNNFISSNINSQLIYDDDVTVTRNNGTRGKDVQLKNVINVGFTLGF